MKKYRLSIIILFSLILFFLFICCEGDIEPFNSFDIEISLKNYPNIENYSTGDKVIYIEEGWNIYADYPLCDVNKINDNDLYGKGSCDFEDSNNSIDLYLFIYEDNKQRISKNPITFTHKSTYYVDATWNENETINIIQDDVNFFDKTFWNYYLPGKFTITITNIDTSLPFSQTFRMLLSDNNNVNTTNIFIMNFSDGELYSHNFIKVGEDYESAQYYIKIEEYNSTSEQYELTRISKEKIISIVDGDPNEYNTIVDWNGGSPIITEDDFKLFDDTAWDNVVQ